MWKDEIRGTSEGLGLGCREERDDDEIILPFGRGHERVLFMGLVSVVTKSLQTCGQVNKIY